MGKKELMLRKKEKSIVFALNVLRYQEDERCLCREPFRLPNLRGEKDPVTHCFMQPYDVCVCVCEKKLSINKKDNMFAAMYWENKAHQIAKNGIQKG